jgi:heme oxygenase
MADRTNHPQSPRPSPEPFSARLRQSTSREHAAAESTSFFRRLFQGEVTERQYAEYLAGLQQIYLALENNLRQCHAAHQPAGRFYQQGLLRADALLQDISFYAPGLSPTQIVHEGPQPLRRAVHRYCRAIDEAARADNLLLPAHAYVRYLGDLSGGQILGKCVAEHFGLAGNAPQGLQFYRFPGIADIGEFKNHFRAQLDTLPPDQDAAERIENEAKLAFRLNILLLESLEE